MPPTFSWFLALRYLITRWVNLIGVIGIAVAVWAMIFVIAVFSGFISARQESMRTASPDLLLTGLAPRSDFEVLGPLVAAADPAVLEVAPRLTHYGLLFPEGGLQRIKHTDVNVNAGASQGNYVLLLGIDPAAERRTTDFEQWLAAVATMPFDGLGLDSKDFAVRDPAHPLLVAPELIERARPRRPFEAPPPPLLGPEDGILLGFTRMYASDEIRPGQRVDVVSARFVQQGDQQELKKIKMNLHMAGCFATNQQVFDVSVCLLDIDVLRGHMGEDLFDPEAVPALITDIAIKLRPGTDPDAVKTAVEAAVRDHGGGQALTWRDQNATFLQALDHERNMMTVVLFAVMVVAGFLIFATLNMMVTQKIKDIGILSSLGATPTGVGAIFLLSGIVLGAIGCLLGAGTGFLSAFYLNDIDNRFREWFDVELFPRALFNLPEIPVDLQTGWMVQVVLAALTLSLLVAWLPARKAARRDPIRSLMHD